MSGTTQVVPARLAHARVSGRTWALFVGLGAVQESEIQAYLADAPVASAGYGIAELRSRRSRGASGHHERYDQHARRRQDRNAHEGPEVAALRGVRYSAP